MVASGQQSPWQRFDCPEAERRWRYLADKRIAIEGQGIPMRAWPAQVDQWVPIIAAKAGKYGVPAYWIAAIMALETGGRPGLCRRKKDGSCSTREGIGLMAMRPSTAEKYAGRVVSVNELLGDHDLQIDLGAKMIRDLADRHGGDYVKTAISYNAGSVHCRQGTSGNTWSYPKEPCPQTPWGVLMGCVRTSKPINDFCASSEAVPGRYNCPTLYPEKAIGTHNAALAAGWTDEGLDAPPSFEPPGGDPEPLPVPLAPARAGLGAAALLPLAAAAIVGYYGSVFIAGGIRRRMRA